MSAVSCWSTISKQEFWSAEKSLSTNDVKYGHDIAFRAGKRFTVDDVNFRILIGPVDYHCVVVLGLLLLPTGAMATQYSFQCSVNVSRLSVDARPHEPWGNTEVRYPVNHGGSILSCVLNIATIKSAYLVCPCVWYGTAHSLARLRRRHWRSCGLPASPLLNWETSLTRLETVWGWKERTVGDASVRFYFVSHNPNRPEVSEIFQAIFPNVTSSIEKFTPIRKWRRDRGWHHLFTDRKTAGTLSLFSIPLTVCN